MSNEPKVHLIGNAHLDPIWLWRWQEGCGEVLQTFRSALDRLNEYPDFVFTCSSASYYKWVEEIDPDMFAEIRARVKEGRWVPVNGWWVQPDCNMPSAESFARQALYSQLYYNEKFGRICKTAYNVDSFGHSGMLPQIIKNGGMTAYVMMRPGAHENAEIPNMFMWESFDGTQIPTFHIPDASGYGSGNAEAINRSRDLAEKLINEEGHGMMIFYGVATGEPITKLLMSGVVPGILTCILLCLMVYIIAKKRDMPVEDEPFSWKRLWDATKDSVLALLMPIIILVTIYFGICTATESAAIAAVYGIIIAKFVYRSVSWKGLWEIFKKSALQTVVVSIMVVTAQLFGWIVTYYNIPNLLATPVYRLLRHRFPVPCAGDAVDCGYVYGGPVCGDHRSAHPASRCAGLWYRSHLLRLLYCFRHVHRYRYAALRPLSVRLLQSFPAALCQGVQGDTALYRGGDTGCHHPDLPAADRYITSQSGKIRGLL